MVNLTYAAKKLIIHDSLFPSAVIAPGPAGMEPEKG